MKQRVDHVRIAGIAAAIPATSQTIDDFPYMSAEAKPKFIESTGVYNRPQARPEQCTSDFACAAANHLLEALGWERHTIDLVIFVTQTPDYIVPATAPSIQHRLGLPKTVASFDIILGCSGFTYGLTTAAAMLQGGLARRALLLVGDTPGKGAPKRVVEKNPPIFADCGTATALEYTPGAAPIHSMLWSDGSGAEVIMAKYSGCRQRLHRDDFYYEEDADGFIQWDAHFQMDGLEVFNFTIREVPASMKAILQFAEVDKEAIDYFVCHQANIVLNETIRKFMKIPPEKHPYTLRQFGNTSSATIPLTIASELRQPVTEGCQQVLLSGFGVGLSWANVVCQLDHIVCPEIIRL